MSQDFSGQNLRGRSFKGQNLEGANFSGADIRGADFTGANLTDANFSYARAGLQHQWILGLILTSFIVVITTGFISGQFKLLSLSVISSKFIQNDTFIPAVAIFGIVLFVLMTFIRYGLTTLTILVWIVILSLIFPLMAILTNIQLWNSTLTLVAGWAGLWVIAGMLMKAIAETYWWVGIWAATGAGLWTVFAFVADPLTEIQVLVVSGIGAWTLAMVGSYIAERAISEDVKFTWIRVAVLALGSLGGTSFYRAKLSNADFTKAALRFTNLTNANLTLTCWHQTQKLDLAYANNTYLMYPKVRKLVTSRQGQNLNFDYQNLRGVNLKGANLADASFIGADLSEATLQDTDLSRAKLVQTQLDRTDFTGATLTGAYIQDWGITTDTKFDGVRCKYVYMRSPTLDNPDPHRKPDNWNETFADGDFADFIKPIFDTLDLYHNQGVDPRAIAISFKQLAENHPEADLRIVGMEVRGEDKFLLRAKTAFEADKSQLSAEYFDTYNEIKSLPEREIKLLLSEKDNQIRRLENMVMTALERPSFYANKPIIQGDITMAGDRNINTDGGNYNERIQGDYVQGNYYAAGQPQSLAQAAAEIQLLLKQLEQTYPSTSTSQQMVVAAEAVNRIESNPLLKERVINAAKEGGLAAFEKAIDNPAGAFIVNAIKGWQEVKNV